VPQRRRAVQATCSADEARRLFHQRSRATPRARIATRVTAAEIVDDVPDPTVEVVAEALRELPLGHSA